MNINKESKQYIRKDAKVKVSSDGLIGNKILVIYDGTFAHKEIEEGDVLANEPIVSMESIMNTFQQSNLNILKFTSQLANGEGTIGKLVNNDSIYNSIAATAASIQQASANAQTLIATLANFTAKLNKEGNLVNDLVSDTVMFRSITATVAHLNTVAEDASVFINNLKEASKNTKTPVGVLLHDETAGANLKSTISSLESGSKKLDEDLEAIQHSFLLRKYFRKKEKSNEK